MPNDRPALRGPTLPGPTLRRRTALSGLLALSLLPVLPRAAAALTAGQAQALVQAAVDDVNQVIGSGASEAAMLREFTRIFRTYADVPTIARSVLGPSARAASPAQLAAFTDAFQGYFSARYGRRFREFIGGSIAVNDARAVRTFFEVVTTVNMRAQAPFELRWLVSDGSGRPLFFNLIIEGVNLMISERTEIGAMLEARGGSIEALTQHLRTLG